MTTFCSWERINQLKAKRYYEVTGYFYHEFPVNKHSFYCHWKNLEKRKEGNPEPLNQYYNALPLSHSSIK